jgi:hypothetical protein
MLGLLLKDIFVLRKSLKIYFFALAFYLVLSITGAFDITMVTGFITLFTMMLPISSFALDEAARWDKFAAALPVGRRGIVGEKYLLVLCLGAFAEALIAILGLALWLLKGGSLGEILLTGLGCMAIALLMNSMLLPLLFKFGAEKGRLITMAVCAVIFLLSFGAAKLTDGPLGLPLPLLNTFLPAIVAAVVALALFISWQISLGIYEGKEL